MGLRILVSIVLTLLILTVVSVGAFEVYHTHRIYPGVSIWGRDVGSMLPEMAAARVTNPSILHEPQITLTGPDRSWEVRPSELGLTFHSEATLAQAHGLGRGEVWPRSLLSRIELLVSGADTARVFVYDESQARRYLEALAEQIDTPAIDATLALDGVAPRVTLARSGRRLDVEETLTALSPAITQLKPATVGLVVHEVPPTVRDAEAARAELKKLLNGPLTLVLEDPREGDPGPWIIAPEELAEMVEIREEAGELRVRMDLQPLRSQLEELAPTLEIEPVDARFRFDERTGELDPISASEEGRTLDVEGTLARISETLEGGGRRVSLVAPQIPPQYPDTASAEELGIVDRVATGESYFTGSPSGRDHNIRVSAAQFDGLIIPPGETFSFNHHLGPVTAEAGYDEAHITAGELLEMEVGGGICQVSTTAYRAAFWGGYPITERWAHGQRIAYYELHGGSVGMDATIYAPHFDLKFVNDRSTPLLIVTEIQEGAHRLLFHLYSTDDGREVEMEGPEVTDRTVPGPPIYTLDESMAPGTVRQWQAAADGLTATVRRRVTDASGALLYNDTFVSRFAPRRLAYRYGPGYEPPQ